MSHRLSAPPDIAAKLRELCITEKIDLEIVEDSETPIRVVQGEPKEPSDLATLKAGGSILCAQALAMAPKLGISTKSMGKLLNCLDIKLKSCSLGCF